MRFISLAAAMAGLVVTHAHALTSSITLPAPDVQAFIEADAASSRLMPYRFAAPIVTSIDTATAGRWSTDTDGSRIWALELQAPGARSLNFGFDRFELPQGAELYIAAGDELLGPYTSAHAADGQLWTPIVRADTASLQLLLPAGAGTHALRLKQVGYGFRGFGTAQDEADKSGSCNVDVVCPEGDGWRDEIRSVARISINGLFVCSGQMVNNTAEDKTPYFLTAAHCVSTEPEAPTLVFYFNYETSVCGGNPDGRTAQTMTGAILRAASEVPSLASPSFVTDFALVELLGQPPASFDVHYAGWDNRDIAPDGGVSIHHPAGDEKRISYEFDPITITSYLGDSGGTTHLKVTDWDVGTTEGGSSGSGLWNFEQRLVGTLSGGYAACGNDDPDWYGRFHEHWFRLNTPRTSLAFWLDPLGSGAETLDGLDANPRSADGDTKAAGGDPDASAAGATDTLIAVLVAFAALRRRRMARR